jgi:centromere-localized protein 2
MNDACNDLEIEIAELEKESVTVLADIKSTIGDLSDLRFGKLNRVSGVSSDLSQEVMKGLERLEYLCNAVEKGWN